jgi:eukaryotic-like serine/threonine-protein kinase
MVAENGQLKVLDFGVAKLVDRKGSSEADETCSTGTNPKTEEGVILGTVSYMSPEQAEGKKIDARSDIFSFGCVLYEMVTGRKAFQRDSKMSTLAAILREEPRLASQIAKDLPLELERIITRCLKKDPRRRFQHVGDVQVELVELKEEVDSGALASAPPRRLEHRSWRWASHRMGPASRIRVEALMANRGSTPEDSTRDRLRRWRGPRIVRGRSFLQTGSGLDSLPMRGRRATTS